MEYGADVSEHFQVSESSAGGWNFRVDEELEGKASSRDCLGYPAIHGTTCLWR